MAACGEQWSKALVGCAHPGWPHHLTLNSHSVRFPFPARGEDYSPSSLPAPGSQQLWPEVTSATSRPQHTPPSPIGPIVATCAEKAPQDGRSWEG